MSLKWGDEKIKGLAKPIPTAERDYSWVGWLILAVASLAGLAYFIWKALLACTGHCI